MPNILFASNNAANFDGCTYTASGHDPTKVPYSVLVNTSTVSPIFKPTTGEWTWIHFNLANININTSITYQTVFQIRDSAGRLLCDSYRNQFQAQFYCRVYDTNGAFASYGADSYQKDAVFDIGMRTTPFLIEFKVYRNGTLIIDQAWAANPNGVDNMATIGFYIDQARFSELFVADGDTRGGRLNMLRPVQVGNYDQWQGSVVALADDDPLSALVTAQPNSRFSLDFGSFGGIQNISNVVINTMTKRGINSPTKLRHSLRRTGVDYDDAAAFDIGFSNQVNITDHPTNPSTALAWDAADIALTEFGFKAEA